MSTKNLNQLINEVRGDALSVDEVEVARQMQICNACRYCEGFCAVFPAMTRRLEFGKADIHYLANLCHNCGACLHACQYAPPHEFAVSVPQAMAKVRVQTYADFAWPRSFGKLYQRNGLTVSLALAASLIVFLLLAVANQGSLWHAPMAGNFYAIFPHNLLVLIFGSIFGFAGVALFLGVQRFWKEQKQPESHINNAQVATKNIATSQLKKILPPLDTNAKADTTPAALNEAVLAALSLQYLGGGHGEGCHNEDDAWTHWRRRFHHFTFYGFMLCFASTSVATLYHYFFALKAPYALMSLPVILGTLGGIGLLIGPGGLFWLKLKRHPQHGDAAQNPMDYGFIALLFFTSLTGLALMIWRDTSALAALLAIHLGFVMALFLTIPYGKMAHGFYRCAALLKFAIEKRMPSNVKLAAD